MQERPSFAIPNVEELQGTAGDADQGVSGGSAVTAVLAKHHDALTVRSGVVTVGETLDEVGRPAIMIGVKTAGDLKGLPKELDGVPVVCQVIGDVDALPAKSGQ